MSKQPHDAWYKSTHWQQRRAYHLRHQPLCAWCQARGIVKQAEIAHHAAPHRGDPVAFWTGELISLCKQCHDSDAQRIEKGRSPKPTIGLDGWPVE